MVGIDVGAATKAKARALKKYEASSEPLARDGQNPTLDLFCPFGPMIVRARAQQTLVATINRYADRLVRENVSTEFSLPSEIVFDGSEFSLAHQTEQLVRRYLSLVGEKSNRVRFEVFWIVSQFAGTPSPVHFHSSDISGVMYLKVPQLDREDDELQKTYISGRQAGYINFLIGGKQRFSKSLVSFRPQVGDFYVFPGWLLHGAEPFHGIGERRSLAFNAYIDAVGR